MDVGPCAAVVKPYRLDDFGSMARMTHFDTMTHVRPLAADPILPPDISSLRPSRLSG
jgi:hypothetical protein